VYNRAPLFLKTEAVLRAIRPHPVWYDFFDPLSMQPKINGYYLLITLVGVLFTWELHEFAHWLTGTLLGNPMALTLNTSYPVSGQYARSYHDWMVTAAGPLITVIEAVVVFILLRKNRQFLLFPVLFTCFYFRLMAAIMNLLNPNDEGRLSLLLGTDVFFISVIVVGFLLYLVYQAAKIVSVTRGQLAATLLLIMLFSSTIILTDQIAHVRIL
jgi:hypothetical protein